MTPPVTARRIKIAQDFGLGNVEAAAVACRKVGLPFFVACALLEKESGGRNVYGHDAGGALSGFPGRVTRGNFEVFEWLVFDQGQTSNGVGPAQITYKGYFSDMEEQGLRPWIPHDNMLFGFRLVKGNFDRHSSWATAGAIYNGGPRPNSTALAYGRDFAAKVEQWKTRLGI